MGKLRSLPVGEVACGTSTHTNTLENIRCFEHGFTDRAATSAGAQEGSGLNPRCRRGLRGPIRRPRSVTFGLVGTYNGLRKVSRHPRVDEVPPLKANAHDQGLLPSEPGSSCAHHSTWSNVASTQLSERGCVGFGPLSEDPADHGANAATRQPNAAQLACQGGRGRVLAPHLGDQLFY